MQNSIHADANLSHVFEGLDVNITCAAFEGFTKDMIKPDLERGFVLCLRFNIVMHKINPLEIKHLEDEIVVELATNRLIVVLGG